MGGSWRWVLLMAVAGALASAFAAQVAVAQDDRTSGGFPLESANEIEGTGKPEVIRGTEETDVILGRGGDDALYGFWSSDLIRGGRGKDYIGGGKYGDHLYGDRWSDVITGEGGRDRIFGGRGGDDLYAGFRPGQPVPRSSPARTDFISGEGGDDFIDASDAPGARDSVRCGDGVDTVVADRGDRVNPDCEVVRRAG